MVKKTEKVLTPLFLFFLPIAASAIGEAGGSGAGPLGVIAGKILNFILLFPKLIVGLALVYFFFGLIKYVSGVGDKDKIAARETMIYGIIGLFVMVSVWGIVNLVRSVLSI